MDEDENSTSDVSGMAEEPRIPSKLKIITEKTHSFSAFKASPRAGHVLTKIPSRSKNLAARELAPVIETKSKDSTDIFYSKSRDNRINLTLEESEWAFETRQDLQKVGTYADNMLAATISCVMLMAAEAENIPEEYLTFAENYLACIKDEANCHPPNVHGILQHIARLKAERTPSPVEEPPCVCEAKPPEEVCSAQPNLQWKKNVAKRSAIPIRKKCEKCPPLTMTPDARTPSTELESTIIEPDESADIDSKTSLGSQKYYPTPYTFRIPRRTFTDKGQALVKCPPFHIQLDHTIAVVWSMFCKNGTDRSLGVVQLQWALNFLQGIRDSEGKHPKDIAVCIEVMEEALIEQYASMADEVEPKDSMPTPSAPASVKSLSASKEKLNAPGFSVTYKEMSKYKPNRVEQLFTAKEGVSMTKTDIQKKIDDFKLIAEAANSENALGTAYSRGDMVELLKMWRKEQICKLQEELQRLHSIETYIGNLDKDNFKPYLDNQQVMNLPLAKEETEENASAPDQ